MLWELGSGVFRAKRGRAGLWEPTRPNNRRHARGGRKMACVAASVECEEGEGRQVRQDRRWPDAACTHLGGHPKEFRL